MRYILLIFFSVIGYFNTLAQSSIIIDESVESFVSKYDSLVEKIRAIDKYDTPYELKVYSYRKRFTYHGGELRENKEVYYFNNDSLRLYTSSIPPKVLFGKNLDGVLRSYKLNSKELNELSKLKGFITQTQKSNNEELYSGNDISFSIFYSQNIPVFGFVKLGYQNFFIDQTSLDDQQKDILKKFIDERL